MRRAPASTRWQTAVAGLAMIASACAPRLEETKESEGPPAAPIRGEPLISSEHVGILRQPGASDESVRQLADAEGLEVTTAYPAGVYVFAVGQPKPKAELLQLAVRLRNTREVVAQAGLVIRFPGTRYPALISDQIVVRLRPDAARKDLEALNARYGAWVVQENPFVPGQFLLQARESSSLDGRDLARQYAGSRFVADAQPNLVHVMLAAQAVCNPGTCSSGAMPDPSDPDQAYTGAQWHHRNSGQCCGVRDADIDTPRAWQMADAALTLSGGRKPVIAVMDYGFDLNPDSFELWQNPNEISDGADDAQDPNPYADDIHGWNFIGCATNGNSCDASYPFPSTSCGCGDLSPQVSGYPAHGTNVAGLAVAKDVKYGIKGACPGCRLMQVGISSTDYGWALAFGYAQAMGADVISNSWYPGDQISTTLVSAIRSAAACGRDWAPAQAGTAACAPDHRGSSRGSTILFAMYNGEVPYCDPLESIPGAAENEVVAIGTATNTDRAERHSAFGNCLDLLAPSAQSYDYLANSARGTLWIPTTDRPGAPGMNSQLHQAQASSCPTSEFADREYTACFDGNSAATPIAAGVAGLVLEADPELTREEVQHALYDTTDKIEPAVATYDRNTGRDVSVGGSRYGWGRLNAFEAVRVVAPVAAGGRGGVDIFMRDHALDWGNQDHRSDFSFAPDTVSRFGDSSLNKSPARIPYWESMDIKVDSPTDGYRAAPTPANFDGFLDETPSTSGDNRVYVRVRNRGPKSSGPVRVRLHWAQFGTALPPLPDTFWTNFQQGISQSQQPAWHSIPCSAPVSSAYLGACEFGDVPYSGPSAPAPDGARIAMFTLPAVALGQQGQAHVCLFAAATSERDPLVEGPADTNLDDVSRADNNVTHRNYVNVGSEVVVSGRQWKGPLLEFLVRNPFRVPITTALRVEAPSLWDVVIRPVGLKPWEQLLRPLVNERGRPTLPRLQGRVLTLRGGQEARAALTISGTLPVAGRIRVIQERIDGQRRSVMGGFTVEVPPITASPD